MVELGQRLKQLRSQKGMTQEQLADVIGISRSALSMYELNQREPDLDTLIKFADYFAVTTDYLLGRCCHNAVAGEELKKLVRMIIRELNEEYSTDVQPETDDPSEQS